MIENHLKEKIGEDSFESWFAPKDAVMEGIKEKYKARPPARFYTPFLYVLVIETHSKFFKDQIISRFGSVIHEVARELGYTTLHILVEGEEIPRAEPPLTPEQWSQAKYVLSKVGRFARSQGDHKPSSALFTHGKEDDIVEEPQPKPKAAHVYHGTQGLAFVAGGNGCSLPEEEKERTTLGNQGVIFPVIINQQRKEI